ncbi:NAD(P)H-binding protein [Jannaschia sp. LMIT008]|uniref:NAD(P)H-binding protein n=1 Tax=Jannaschia maritima TaxID=3032585 RepID=UPI0028119C80|nr:NAD(P)H-binding protein [Jannaschia sp. LMIT008]
MILVTTPTGDIGTRVLKGLLEGGEPIRVVLRDPSNLDSDVRGQIDVVQGSHADATVIGPALDGIDAVFWLPPGPPTAESSEAAYVDFSRAFRDALRTSSVSHVVGVSALGRGWGMPAGHATASIAMDDMIGATGVAYRALACASLMDNVARQAEPIREAGLFFQPSPGHLKLPHVAKADVAARAVDLLRDRSWTGVEDVPLLGPEELTFDEMAAIVTDVVGREVRFREIAMADFADMMRGMGATEGMVKGYVEMLTAKNEGMDLAFVPPDRRDTPTTFREWCHRELVAALSGGDARS